MAPINGSLFIERLNQWKELGRAHVSQRYKYWEDFGRTLLGDLIHDNEQWVEHRATTSDVHDVYAYLLGVGGHNVGFTVNMMTCSQVFFVTETGMLGLSHIETKPGDRIWVLHGGNIPFTLIPRKSHSEEGGQREPEDYDFGGSCYVHGLINGELFYWDDEAPEEKLL